MTTRRQFLFASGVTLAAADALLAQKAHTTDPNCVFCKIVGDTVPAYKLWEDKHLLAFLDNKPIMPGHTLLVPKEHHSYLFELGHHDYSGMFDRVRTLEPPLRSAMQAKRIGLIVEGFGVDHVHIHMVPITGRGQLLQQGRTDVTAEEFKSTAEKISSAIEKS